MKSLANACATSVDQLGGYLSFGVRARDGSSGRGSGGPFGLPSSVRTSRIQVQYGGPSGRGIRSPHRAGGWRVPPQGRSPSRLWSCRGQSCGGLDGLLHVLHGYPEGRSGGRDPDACLRQTIPLDHEPRCFQALDRDPTDILCGEADGAQLRRVDLTEGKVGPVLVVVEAALVSMWRRATR
jgi:hypothetical protein